MINDSVYWGQSRTASNSTPPSASPTPLAAGSRFASNMVWWALLNQARLVATTMCSTGSNVCALSDGIGTSSLSGYNSWQGRPDWCSGYEMSSVTTNGTWVGAGFTLSAGDYDRLVQSRATASGVNMFNSGNCGGTTGSAPWTGYENFSAPQ